MLILDIEGCKLAAVTGKPLAAQPLKVDFWWAAALRRARLSPAHC